MKYFLIVPILAAMILSGCTKENTVVGPQQVTQQPQQLKSEWIQINHSPSLSVENTYTASKTIVGNVGGTIELSQIFKSNGHMCLVTAKLTIPKNAFSGSKLISYTVDTDHAGISFSPSPIVFSKTLSLDLIFTGIDISDYNPSKLAFAYLDGQTIVKANLVYANADIAQGLLVVLGAQITHFSRYGWSTVDGSTPDSGGI